MNKKEDAHRILRQMLYIRRFEETVIDLWATVETEGHRHVYIGQEAIAAVVCELLRDDDKVTTTHRNHGHIVARGADPNKALAEIIGRSGGYNRGRGGSAGLTAADVGFLFTTGQVGGGIGLGTGGGLAQKTRGNGGISATFFGDGALEEGIAFESMNMAALFDLPVLYVCENNSVGVTTGRADNEWSSSSMAAETLGDIPRALQIRTEIVAGEDVEALYAAASKLIAAIRDDGNPAFIETRSHRWPGSRGFNPTLVAGATDLNWILQPSSVDGDHAEWINNFDPIVRFGRTLIDRDELDEATLRSIDDEVQGVVDAAREYAVASPPVSPGDCLTGVYA